MLYPLLLLSRCSILAAANSVFGRWDDAKAEENIDFMPTILSRYKRILIISPGIKNSNFKLKRLHNAPLVCLRNFTLGSTPSSLWRMSTMKPGTWPLRATSCRWFLKLVYILKTVIHFDNWLAFEHPGPTCILTPASILSLWLLLHFDTLATFAGSHERCSGQCSRGWTLLGVPQEIHRILQVIGDLSVLSSVYYKCLMVWFQLCWRRFSLYMSTNKCYCRARCGPRLTEEAAEKLKNRYVLMRNSSREVKKEFSCLTYHCHHS